MKQPFFNAVLKFHDDTANLHWRVPLKYIRIMLGLNASLSFNEAMFWAEPILLPAICELSPHFAVTRKWV
jgi:hypothetical protein